MTPSILVCGLWLGRCRLGLGNGMRFDGRRSLGHWLGRRFGVDLPHRRRLARRSLWLGRCRLGLNYGLSRRFSL